MPITTHQETLPESTMRVVVLSLPFFVARASAFATTCPHKRVSFALRMAKKIRNKQADMLKKLELAKKQAAAAAAGKDASSVRLDDPMDQDLSYLSDKEIKERNDRLRFAELLKTKPIVLDDLLSDGYLSRQQEEAEIAAASAGVDRIFEGDSAPVEPFEDLVLVGSSDPLGPEGAKKLVPWTRKTDTSDYLVILTDPRMKSPELRETVETLRQQLSDETFKRLIVINADTPAENRRWLKKNGISNLNVYSDENKTWMRSYTALGEERWSMTMYIIANERVQKLARELDVVFATRAIQNAVKSLKKTL